MIIKNESKTCSLIIFNSIFLKLLKNSILIIHIIIFFIKILLIHLKHISIFHMQILFSLIFIYNFIYNFYIIDF